MPTVLHVLPHPGGGAETYVDLLEALPGYRHERVALSVTRSRRRGALSVLERRRQVLRRAGEFDLVHVHGDMAAMLAAPALAGRPLLITSHGLHRLRRSCGAAGWLVRRRLRAAVAASVRTICIARDERADLAAVLPPALHEPPRRGAERRAAAGPRRARPAGRAAALAGARGGTTVAVLFAGQLEPRKDPLGAIAATEAARRRGADLVLLLAGSGPLAEEVARPRRAAASGARPARRPRGPLRGGRPLPPPLPPRGDVVRAAGGDGARAGAGGRRRARQPRDGRPPPAPSSPPATAARWPTASPRSPATRDERARLGAAARERIRAELSVERFREATREQYEAALGAASAPQSA